MKRNIRNSVVAVTAGFTMMATLTACGNGDSASEETSGSSSSECASDLSDVTVGFVAVGPEGAWREANEKDVQTAFEDAGATVKYAGTADNDQANQIQSMQSFIDEGVDLILLSATEATGWEDTLQEAADAEIPVILLDRMIEPDNQDLYATHLGPDNYAISSNAAKWANEQFPDGANYAVLEGPAGLSVVNERNAGWDDTINDNLTKVDSQDAGWSTADAKDITSTMLKSNNNDIQLIFAQNDEMGLGAAQAVEEAGLVPGDDVKIITIDGTKAALEALSAGQLSLVAEYNPIFGQDAVDASISILCGEDVEKNIVIESQIFDSPEAADEALPTRAY
ncbi:ABC transporter substrate-binding protein [Changpingibacter yushuensis]|uniref:ABC transporter substrate-binding protein n=1 Tax=Changpingibacter yushuensis TaxID=2758440 RepID=UPI001C711903|nr:ABC transporter substrate-binding protein [Changpingibacter yushuensis]